MGLFVGLMSGTSIDGVDSVVVDADDGRCALVAAHDFEWPTALRERVRRCARGAALDATALAALDAEVGAFLAGCVTGLLAQADLDAAEILAIGSHGQTVAHAPGGTPPVTLQLGDGSLIAERTGITTVNDFRRRDLAAGGEGAPLAPAFHAAMLRGTGGDRAGEDRVVLNLGGIANVTVLPRAAAAPVTGFDTGPANCLLDEWARRYLGRAFDDRGAWAASSTADPNLLAALRADPYFAEAPPKSTGTQHFSGHWLDSRVGEVPGLPPATVQATLLALTVTTVADAVRTAAPCAARVLVCGGGVHNTAMLDALARELGVPVESTAAHGLDPDRVEAMAFAWLAHRTLHGLPGNLPSVTGAAGPRVLGAIHPA